MKMDGKNREEQENGAKVRDLEEFKAENRKRKRRRRITVGILAGAILAAGIGDVYKRQGSLSAIRRGT